MLNPDPDNNYSFDPWYESCERLLRNGYHPNPDRAGGISPYVASLIEVLDMIIDQYTPTPDELVWIAERLICFGTHPEWRDAFFLADPGVDEDPFSGTPVA
jgi:hypothetical protein